MQSAKLVHVSERDYLARELNAEVRSEYVAGQVFAMVGASRAHNRISGNIYARLLAHLRGAACSPYMADVRVQVASRSAYYYPDVVVTCDPRDRSADPENYSVSYPVLLVEVLSRSTEATDRREKLLAYQTLESLREYVLVSQIARRVEIYRRAAADWEVLALAPGDTVHFSSVEYTADFEDIYDGSDVPVG
jgi:Uma2 family endonuclease